MEHSLAGVVLAAGKGSRLGPLTRYRPKPLCPVGNRPLLDHALDRLLPLVEDVAVNLHHLGAQVDAHLPPDVHRSWERPEALGTAGALGALRAWIDGRPVLLANSDCWFGAGLDLTQMVEGWNGERVRLLTVRAPGRGDFGDLRYCGVALMPWTDVRLLEPEPSGLYEVSWRREHDAGRLDLVETSARFIDCGTPADYLTANLLQSDGASAVDPTARIERGAVVEESVVWADCVVRSGEVLRRAVRTPEATVLIR